jgi:hypothetical protein
MTGWTVNRKPNGITLYIREDELRRQGPGVKVFLFDLDEDTCLHLRNSISEAKKKFWKKEKRKK